MKNLNNKNHGVLHLHHKQSGKRLNLRPGVNQLSDEDSKLFEVLLAKQENLEEVQEMHDVAQELPAEELQVEEVQPEEVKEVRKPKRKKVEDLQVEQLENLNEII